MPHGYSHGSYSASTTTPTATPMQSTTNARGQVAPPGFHYMPDGTLMSDAEHARLYGETLKTIKNFDIDLSALSQSGEERRFIITAEKHAEFILEVKNNTNQYYNFQTKTFTSTQADLKVKMNSTTYINSIFFPSIISKDIVNGAVTSGVKVIMNTAVANKMAVGDKVTGNDYLNSNHVTVAALNPDTDNVNEFSLSEAVAISDDESLQFVGNDKYDIYLYAVPGTKHTDYKEVRFGDGSIDLNSSTGSNSLMMQKNVYQYADVLLTLSMSSLSAAITPSASSNSTFLISKGKSTKKIPFTISTTSASGASFTIKKQPTTRDVAATISRTVGSEPELLPGENEYPEINNTDTVNGDFTAGSTKIVMDTAVALKMEVGTKVTVEGELLANTVDGATTNSNRIVFDNNVATRASVGDRLFRSDDSTMNGVFRTRVILVTHLDPDGDNPKEIQVSEVISCANNANITFQPKCNQSLTTVAALNPDGDNANEFSLSQSCGLVDGTTLSFSNRKNYQWPLNNIENITTGLNVSGSVNLSSNTKVDNYEDTTTIMPDTVEEKIIVNNLAPFKNTKGKKPTITDGLVSLQDGTVVFNKQAKLALAGDTITFFGYGYEKILDLCGYDIRITDLAMELTEVTTTTTAASSNSTSVALTAIDGILNGTSTVSGIGIDPSVANPTVNSGASGTGSGTVVLSAAQTLEDGITLTFSGAGKVATITGNIEVLKTGTANQTIKFDLDKLLASA